MSLSPPIRFWFQLSSVILMSNLVQIQNLSVAYPLQQGAAVYALNGLSLTLERGEAVGVVGETGSGKTTLALTLMGLAPTARVQGQVMFDGQGLPIGDEQAMRLFRWRRIALAFQGSGSAFDPVYPVGQQVI